MQSWILKSSRCEGQYVPSLMFSCMHASRDKLEISLSFESWPICLSGGLSRPVFAISLFALHHYLATHSVHIMTTTTETSAFLFDMDGTLLGMDVARYGPHPG
jgi:hypothetical protein